MNYSVPYIQVYQKISLKSFNKEQKEIYPQLIVYTDFQLEGYLYYQKDCKVYFRKEFIVYRVPKCEENTLI